MNKLVWVVILVLVLGGIYWSMNGAAAPEETMQTEETTSAPIATPGAQVIDNIIAAGAQKPGKEVIISTVTLKEDASVVVHKDAAGAPGEVIGSVTLKAGAYSSLPIALSQAVKAGDVLYPMLHPDNGDGQYSAKEEGTPLKNAAGEILMVKVVVQ